METSHSRGRRCNEFHKIKYAAHPAKQKEHKRLRQEKAEVLKDYWRSKEGKARKILKKQRRVSRREDNDV